MIATGQGNFYPRQRGAAIMVMLLILIMGSAYLLLAKLNNSDPQQPRAVDTTAELGAIRDALIGYAQTHGGCLPCPGTAAAPGEAAPSCGAVAVGDLPWIDLGTGAHDRWGRRYTYMVDGDFTTTCMPHPATADLSVSTSAGTTNGLVAAVLSHGANGFGAGGLPPNPPANHIYERANRRTDLAATGALTQRVHTTDSAAIGGPFDDLAVWVSRAAFIDQYNEAVTPPPGP